MLSCRAKHFVPVLYASPERIDFYSQSSHLYEDLLLKMSNTSAMVVCNGDRPNPPRLRRTTAVLECSYCRRKFLNDADRHIHIQEVHLGIKENFECKQCGKQFSNRHILQLHTRLHASQSSNPNPDPPPDLSLGDAITVTSTTQTNGSLNIKFSVSLNISLRDGFNPMDLDSRLNELLANATKASFQEAILREKKLASQLKKDDSMTLKSTESNTVESGNESEMSSKVEQVPKSSSSNNLLDNQEKVENQEKTVTEQTDLNDDKVKSQENVMNPFKTVSLEKTFSPDKNSNSEGIINASVPFESVVEIPKPVMVTSPRPPVRVNPHNRPKKSVGLTKIRMEDCQRCDACSCIYLDVRDYIKHMKNFHKQDVIKQEPIKPKHKPKARVQARRSKRQQRLIVQQQQQAQELGGRRGKSRSCCKQCKCRGNHGTLEPLLPIVRPVLGRSGRRSSISTQDSWNQFAQHLQSAEGVVLQSATDLSVSEQDHMPDLSDLLSQVEVKIKTEPVDPDELPLTVKIEPSDDMDSDSCSVY